MEGRSILAAMKDRAKTIQFDRGEPLLIAGASGVVGLSLVRLMIEDGWKVFGSTRTPSKAEQLSKLGIVPVVFDVFDVQAVVSCLERIQPRFVFHQLTDLPDGLDPNLMPEATLKNAKLRDEGTRNLVKACHDVGVKRLVAQSLGFAYAPGALPFAESHPLNVEAPGRAGINARGVKNLEDHVLGSQLDGIALRYGRLYGAGTGFDIPNFASPLHVEAAAQAAKLALYYGRTGIYNLAEDDGTLDCTKAIVELGFDPQFRIGV